MEEEKYIVALEIGSSKIKGAVGVLEPGGSLTVKAVEEEKLVDSVRYGCIRNVAETSRTIRLIVDRLESRMAPRKIEGVYVAVGGRSVSSSVIDIERRLPNEQEITSGLIDEIFTEALSQPLHERAVIDVTPRDFRVNGAPAKQPVGNYGSNIIASLNLVSCRSQLLNNLKLVIEERLHLRIRDIFVRQLIEGDLVLLNDEKRLGCMLVDFGAETTTVSIYKNGALQYLVTLPMGSRNITLDITSLNHLEENAEVMKINGGNAMPGADNSPYTAYGQDFTEINNYVSARAGEIIANIMEQMSIAGFSAENLPGGIILVGQGAKLNGFTRRLESMSDMKVRVGMPSSRIRIADSHIAPADSVDVIALLNATRDSAVECMTRPAPVVTPTPVVVIEEPAVVIDEPKTEPVNQPAGQTTQHKAPDFAYEPVKPIEEKPQPRAEEKRTAPAEDKPYTAPEPKKPGWGQRVLAGFRVRVADLFTEPDEDE